MNKFVYNKTWANDKIEKYVPTIKFIVRTALIISTCLILISSILILLFGKISSKTYDEIYAIIIWYATLFSMWTLICSLSIILSIAVYKKLTKQNVWIAIKRETILVMTTIISGIILYKIV